MKDSVGAANAEISLARVVRKTIFKLTFNTHFQYPVPVHDTPSTQLHHQALPHAVTRSCGTCKIIITIHGYIFTMTSW
jgi:hypothetical protein